MDISPIRLVRARCCANLGRLRWQRLRPAAGRQSTERGNIDTGKWSNPPSRARRPIEHPGRDLQPSVRGLAGKAAAEDGDVALVDHLMNMDLPPGPRMPRVEKLSSSGPVGVPSSSCTITNAHTHRWATDHRHQRPCNGRLRSADQLRRPHRRWCQNPSCTKTYPGPLDRGRPQTLGRIFPTVRCTCDAPAPVGTGDETDDTSRCSRAFEGLADAFNAHASPFGVMSYFSANCTLEMPRGSRAWGARAEGKAQVRSLLATRFVGIPDVHYGEGLALC